MATQRDGLQPLHKIASPQPLIPNPFFNPLPVSCLTYEKLAQRISSLVQTENRGLTAKSYLRSIPRLTKSEERTAKSEIMSSTPKIRVLVAKPGLDGHDRGAKVIARALRDAGMEVIYSGLRQTPEMVVTASLQEDVDVIGLSILSGAHNAIVPRVMELLKQNHMDDVLVLVGGIIPDQDVEALKKGGVAAVFQPGTPMDSIIEFIRTNVKPRGVTAG